MPIRLKSNLQYISNYLFSPLAAQIKDIGPAQVTQAHYLCHVLLKLRVHIKDNNNSPHVKFHCFLFPFTSKFPDLNFTPYVLYIYSCYIWNPYVTQIVSLGYLWAQQILWCRLPFFWISVLPRLGRATGISKTKSLNKVDETLSSTFICVFSQKLLLKVIYHWINMFKPVMHLFCWSTAIFKLFQKHKGPSRSLYWVLKEIPAIAVNPRCEELK